MAKAYALILGVILGGHGLIGLFIEGAHLLSIFNVDLAVDILYLLCAAALLTVAVTKSRPAALRGTILVVALLLLILAVAGLFDRTVWGLLPTGLTLVDLIVLFGAGGIGVVVSFLRHSPEPLQTAGKPIV
ncbi:hypothetical protein OH146_00375 [Salinibacterium sp. SYSU T00001]|uniref:hypothetical protein n=1 Tax=Homoserinimonas sedimenticola TaxID=2986805 RepID=UPI002235602B|nr:hypothetical protein [Salinibacterium sedimenticola]MCW4384225.1 hypothetical protein [Salinibacterium sedimenticola]